MNRPWSHSIAFALLLGFGGIAHSQQASLQGKELVTNGSFENALEEWQYDGEVVDDPREAHSGDKCLSAEVTERNQHHTLQRWFDLDATRIYRLSVWVKATNRTKLAIWAQPERGERFNIAQDQNIPPRWVRKEHGFSVPKTGRWQIQFIAPSSHGAPPGQMWLDDVSLFEVAVPKAADVTHDDGYDDFPSLASDSAGTVWAAWLSDEDGNDRARLAILDAENEAGVEVRQQWNMDLPEGAYVLDPRVVTRPTEGAWLLCSAEVDGNWDLYAAHSDGRTMSDTLRLTTSEAVDRTPVGVALSDAVWVIWESNPRGERGIWAARLQDGGLSKPVRLSRRGSS
ncbi:MAG: carbohydrate binding domain-containing protein, partial [Armatimonadota bacterium]